MRSLIIGITGCSGSHLAEHLLNMGFEVLGTKRKEDSLDNIKDIIDKIRVFDIDICNKKNIISILNESLPDQIYFLASALAADSINKMSSTNVEGTLMFFDCMREISCTAKTVLTSSSAVYGIQKHQDKLTEEAELFPSTHYGLSKVFQENIAMYYRRNHDLKIVIARPFNFTGPRENPFLVVTDFARQIIDIENDLREPVINVGNLDNRRDFTDVRDTINGLAILAEKGRSGEVYNVCSGNTHSIKSILNKLLSMSTKTIEIKTSAIKTRVGEVNIQTGDNSKIYSKTGWKPLIPLDSTLKDILVYNRNKVNLI